MIRQHSIPSLLLLLALFGPAAAFGQGAPELSPAWKAELGKMDFMVGKWDVDAKIRTPGGYIEGSGSMDVRFAEDGSTMIADMNIPFQNFTVEGRTRRVYNPARGLWDIAWIPSSGPSVPDIEGRFRDGRFIEINYGSDANGAFIGRLVVFDITEDHFLVRKDRLYDNGSVRPEIWVYEATRIGEG